MKYQYEIIGFVGKLLATRHETCRYQLWEFASADDRCTCVQCHKLISDSAVSGLAFTRRDPGSITCMCICVECAAEYEPVHLNDVGTGPREIFGTPVVYKPFETDPYRDEIMLSIRFGFRSFKEELERAMKNNPGIG